MAKPSTLPEWASDTNFSSGTKAGTVTKLEPALAYKKQGWVPSLQWFGQYANWLLNLVYQWCAYLDNLHGEADFLNKAYAWVGSHSFTPATATAAGLTATGNTSGAGIVATGGTSGRGATLAAGGGNTYGAHCTGSGTFSGVHGVGGATGAGVTGTGGASGGVGGGFTGTVNSVGVSAIGNGTAAGVYGQGGNTDGIGVYGLGQGAGAGGYFQGGSSNGRGLTVIGDGSADGIDVTADTGYAINAEAVSSAINAVSTGTGGGNFGVLGFGYSGGVFGTATGAGNGDGVIGEGSGLGAGVRGTGGANGAGVAGEGGATSGAGVAGTSNSTSPAVQATNTSAGPAASLIAGSGPHITFDTSTYAGTSHVCLYWDGTNLRFKNGASASVIIA